MPTRTGRRKIKPTAETLGARADALYALRERRLELQREVEALKAQESQLRDEAIAELKQQGLHAARGDVATISHRKVNRFGVDDWDKTLAAIRRRKLWQLLERRVAQRACAELHEHGKLPAGIGVVEVDDLSITKARR